MLDDNLCPMNEILDDKHSQQTITRSDLAEALFQEVGLPRKECEGLLGDGRFGALNRPQLRSVI